MLIESMYDYRFEQPKAIMVDKCSLCSEEIFTGDQYYNFNGEVICEDCLSEYTGYFKKEA